jgi:hypothetical protein
MSTSVTVKNVRLAYVHLVEPRAAAANAEPKYSVTLIIPKTDTANYNLVRDAAKAAREARWGATKMANLRSPFREAMRKTKMAISFAAKNFAAPFT